MVWIHTIPKNAQFSRAEEMEMDGKEIVYPELENSYLVKMLYEELGACTSTGEHLAPLSWTELESWQRQTGVKLAKYEVEILKKASEAYVAQTVFSKDPACLAPVIELRHTTSSAVMNKIQSLLKKGKNGN